MDKKVADIHQDLIDACKANSCKAQCEIYKLYYKAMYNTSIRILNNAADAEDVMQESFLDAFRKIDQYSGSGSFGGWLKRIVVNNSLDAVKKQKESSYIDDHEVEVAEKAEEIFYDEEIFSSAEKIKSAVKMLPDEYRTVISLFLFEGYDHEEISSILKISNASSRTRYSRAKSKLVQILNRN
ncbi:MAG: sigma-70 family RNA polymerase sigma factor [Bacteroidales bacterium]|nr:sigma-70 family RNA polymerase sigma factor [Bacteroidales bacterium]